MLPTQTVVFLYATLIVALIVPVSECLVSKSLARYETTTFFRCQDRNIDHWAAGSTVLNYQWILPSGEILRVENRMANSSKHALLRNGFILRIQDVDKNDLGLYVCLVFSNQTSNEVVYIAKHDLSKDIYWPGETTDYTINIQYGFLAGFVVLVVMAMVCYNYDQYQERHDVDDQGRVGSCGKKRPVSNGQEIPVIVVTEDDSCHHNQGFQKEESIQESGEADTSL